MGKYCELKKFTKSPAEVIELENIKLADWEKALVKLQSILEYLA